MNRINLNRAISESLKLGTGYAAPETIIWDHDDAYRPDLDLCMEPEQFTWCEVDFDLQNIRDAEFKAHLVNWISRETNLDGISNADPESWEGIWTELQKGNDIHTRVQIALAYQPCYENERLHIADDWHRIALYVKVG